MIMKFGITFWTIAFITMTMVSCSGGEMEQNRVVFGSLKDVPDKAWEELSKKNIFFGHQSVGLNIISGINELMADNPKIKLNIVENSNSKDFKNGIFSHSKVGENTKPKSKIEDFSRLLNQGIGKKADVAALKFCYVDIIKDSDVLKIFDDYKTEVTKLKKDFDDMTIIHFTAPLTLSKANWKTALKKLLGLKDFWEYDDNVKRNEYNQILIQEYRDKEPIFDIAMFESTKPDGTRQSFELNGETYYSLVPEYTEDGGHLNELGRKKIAEQLILFLVNLT